MNVICPTCGLYYNDEFNWTTCPGHPPLEYPSISTYCKKHDLFNCYFCNGCKPESEPKSTQHPHPPSVPEDPSTPSQPH